MNKKIFNTAFTMGATHVNRLYLQRIAFTMAEILLSLTIIGVVAAITLPSLTGNINERTWNAQRKALYARMSQAVALMGSLNGYGIGATESETASNAAKAFVTNGLAKVYKINNICDNEHITDCGFPAEFMVFSQTESLKKKTAPKNLTEMNKLFTQGMTYTSYQLVYSQIDTNTAAFETANGESILTIYNPYCNFSLASPAESSYENLLQPTMCANFLYDLNGLKGPNKVGKDIGFITVFYPTDSQVVAPFVFSYIGVRKDNNCGGTYSLGCLHKTCREKYGAEAKITNLEEAKAIFVNRELSLGYVGNAIITSTPTPNDSSKYYQIGLFAGRINEISIETDTYFKEDVFCIK